MIILNNLHRNKCIHLCQYNYDYKLYFTLEVLTELIYTFKYVNNITYYNNPLFII
jgi:hypothetical protein